MDRHKLYRIILAAPTGKMSYKENGRLVSFNAFHNEQLRLVFTDHNRLRLFFFDNSLPFDDSGFRIVPKPLVEGLNEQIKLTMVNAEIHWAEYLIGFNALIDEAKATHGGYVPSGYHWPTLKDIEKKHYIVVQVADPDKFHEEI